jgi:hypothetical protein
LLRFKEKSRNIKGWLIEKSGRSLEKNIRSWSKLLI